MARKETLDAAVIGGGSWGTALGTLLARLGRDVCIWVRREEQAAEINEQHTNSRYLPGIKLPGKLRASTDMEALVDKAPVVFMAMPSRSFREVARQVGDHARGDHLLIHLTKGLEVDSFKRMSQILREETCCLKLGVLSGPNLAGEVVKGDPAGAVVASHYAELVKTVQALFRGGFFRVYSVYDVVGTELGGAFKNIIALSAGMADGMGFGDNLKALLVTRGLREMIVYGEAMGADPYTFCGLAGIGDLMATCSSKLSRNYQVGTRLAAGEKLEKILESLGQVAEGVPTTLAVHRQVHRMRLTLPIVDGVHRVLYDEISVEDSIATLMKHPVGDELSELKRR